MESPRMNLHCKLESRPKIVGTLELYHVHPIPANQCWKMSRFLNKKGKQITRLSTLCVQSRGELALCPNLFAQVFFSSSPLV